MNKPYLCLKYVLDTLFALILVFPALLIVILCGIWIKIESKGPVFFIQVRAGYKGRPFKIYKLRTMTVENEREGKPLNDMQRMTRSGRLIRMLSLDELPQILNVLNHTMSFCGPRPLLLQYLPLYTPEQMRRHDVLPGITGWAQVNGRNELSWEQKFERDVFYADHVSLRLDCKIIWMTVLNLLNRKGINAGANDTMAVFTGSQPMAAREADAGG